MHWLDTSALLILTGAALIGAVCGFVRPAIRLATVALAFPAAAWLSPHVAGKVEEWSGRPVPPELVVGATFIAVLVILSVAVTLGRRRFWERSSEGTLKLVERLRWADRLAGAVAAAAIAAAALAVAVFIADLHMESPAKTRLDGSKTLRHARVRVAAVIGSLSAEDRARLQEAVEWVKQQSASAGGG